VKTVLVDGSRRIESGHSGHTQRVAAPSLQRASDRTKSDVQRLQTMSVPRRTRGPCHILVIQARGWTSVPRPYHRLQFDFHPSVIGQVRHAHGTAGRRWVVRECSGKDT